MYANAVGTGNCRYFPDSSGQRNLEPTREHYFQRNTKSNKKYIQETILVHTRDHKATGEAKKGPRTHPRGAKKCSGEPKKAPGTHPRIFQTRLRTEARALILKKQEKKEIMLNNKTCDQLQRQQSGNWTPQRGPWSIPKITFASFLTPRYSPWEYQVLQNQA